MVFPALPALAGAKLFFKSKKFLIPLAVFLLLAAIGGGTYFYLKHQTQEAVTTAVAGADSKATIETYRTKEIITNRVVEIDKKYDDLHDRTTQDYANARASLETAPEADRKAQASPLVVGTLNELDRLRSSRDPNPVPEPDVPAG